MEPNKNNITNLLNKTLISVSLAELIMLPISVVKTNFQNSNKSMFQILNEIIRKRGFLGLYASSVPTIITPILSKSSKYIIYKKLDTDENYPIKNKFINGLTTGFITSILTHPLDFIKVHLQMDKPFLLRNIYRGYYQTLCKVSISTTLLFPIYENISKENNKIISAIFSSIIVTTVLQPLDYLKTRRIYGLKDGNQYFRGLSLSFIRRVPNFIIITYLLDNIK